MKEKINIHIRFSKVLHNLLSVTRIWFPPVGPCSADDAGGHQQNCPINKLPVSPCDFLISVSIVPLVKASVNMKQTRWIIIRTCCYGYRLKLNDFIAFLLLVWTPTHTYSGVMNRAETKVDVDYSIDRKFIRDYLKKLFIIFKIFKMKCQTFTGSIFYNVRILYSSLSYTIFMNIVLLWDLNIYGFWTVNKQFEYVTSEKCIMGIFTIL